MNRNFKTRLNRKEKRITVTLTMPLIRANVQKSDAMDSVYTTEVIEFVEKTEKTVVQEIIKSDVACNWREGFNKGKWIFRVSRLSAAPKKPIKRTVKKSVPKDFLEEPKDVNIQNKPASLRNVVANLANKLDTVEDD